jgi:mannosyltransferase
MGSSLWLDETGTVWAIRGTLTETVKRAFQPGQPSVLFSIVVWLTVAIGGLKEVTLRIPSLVAALIAAICVYRLARRLCDPEGSILAAGLFATYGTVVFAATDARPYALALMCEVLALLMLVKWCETGRLLWGVACVLLTALAVYFHYLCVTVLLLGPLYLTLQDRTARPRKPHLWGMSALLGFLLLLLAPHAMMLWRLRREHSFSGMPEIRDLLDAFVYYRLAGGIVIGLVVTRFLFPELAIRRPTLLTKPHAFLLAWYLGPIIILLLISLFSEAKLFVPRYYIWGVPGLAILAASIISGVQPAPARRIVGLLILMTFCARRIPIGDAAHGGQDWRSAMQTAQTVMQRSDATLLLRSGFPETPMEALGDGSAIEEPLMAPLAMYPVSGKVVMAPCWLDEADRVRLEEVVSRLLLHRAKFLYISPSDAPLTSIWLLGRVSGVGYRSSRLGDFEGMTAIQFTPE